jgi:uncharacterized RDD family membrane protein YckC
VTASAPSGRAWFVTRSIAYLIDALLVGAVAIGATIAVVLVSAAVGGQGREVAERAVPVVLALLPAVLAAYNVFFWGIAGRTPGMALLGVRVVSAGGGPVSWPAALVRAVVLAFLPIGALWSVVDRRGQALHDKLARTLVVRTAPRQVRSEPVGQPGRPSTAVEPVRQPQPS